MAAIYTANHLQKNYGGPAAPRGVRVSIGAGRVGGLLRPDGAGETDTAKSSVRLLPHPAP